MPKTLAPREILEHLVAFDTVSARPNKPLIDWVASYLESHGIPVFRHVKEGEPGKEGLFAHVGPPVEGGVVLSGHTDVVPVKGQDWDTDPFVLTEKDGRLFGRGSTDMKGFDALAIWAMVEAQHRGVSRPLQIALSYDEEIGCKGAIDLVAAMAGLPKARDVIVGEPTMMKAVTGHKGGLAYDVHVRGFEIHSSLLHQGVSAIMWGAKLIDWANQENARLESQPPMGMAGLFDPPYTNMHVGPIRGGTAHNIAAKDCWFKFGIRVVPGETLDQWRAPLFAKVAALEAEMQKIQPNTGIDLVEIFALPPFAPEENNTAEALARRLTGDNSDNFVSYATEASHFQTGGYRVVVCGPGSIEVAHQPNEYLEIAQLNAGQEFMDQLVEELS
ncbi:MAG: acetylornithine deacetylase [Pelagimonas sp.]|nr:acetylornithine deacetylase [Pelagimonas sp.]